MYESLLQRCAVIILTNFISSFQGLQFYFYDCGKIPPPVIMVQEVSFRYSDDTEWIYNDLEFGLDLDSRLALVGPNGAGKSTLLKLIAGQVSWSSWLIISAGNRYIISARLFILIFHRL